MPLLNLTARERKVVFSLAFIMMLRIVGLFMIVPVFSVYAVDLKDATPFLIGVAMGVYGLTQGLLQLPFGVLSDYIGRRAVIFGGLLIFMLGGLVASIAHSIYGVILGRALQGCGAIGSTVMALIADATQEEHRSTAMAIAGSFIGVAFVVAILLGPILTTYFSLQNLFFLSACFSLLAIILLFLLVPRFPEFAVPSRTKNTKIKQVLSLIYNSKLANLNLGIFVLHVILVANFVVFPIHLAQYLGWNRAVQWGFYCPIVIPAFIGAFLVIARAEKHRCIKTYFLYAVVGLALAQGLFYWFPRNVLAAVAGLGIFFGSFAMLEAFLPSLISCDAPQEFKGSALGVYYCCQFFGAFIGGLLGGWVAQQYNLTNVYACCGGVAILWLIITYRNFRLQR